MGTLADYRDRPHWSFSALHTYLHCSAQYYFDKIAKLPRQFVSASICTGSVFHQVAAWISMIRKEGKQPVKADAMELMSDLWSREVRDTPNLRFDEGDTAESCAEEGRNLVGCLVDSIDPAERVISISEPFAVPLIDVAGQVLELPLVGELDLVVEKDKRQILDYKTSARRWPKQQANQSLQGTVYGYAYRQLHDQDVEIRFDVLVKNKTPLLESHIVGKKTADQYNRLIELVKVAEKGIRAECFFPSESFFCSGCGHQEACKAWHRDRTRLISLGRAA